MQGYTLFHKCTHPIKLHIPLMDTPHVGIMHCVVVVHMWPSDDDDDDDIPDS